MKINERFSITSDSMNWILIDKTKKSYYPRMEQALQEIITRSGKNQSTIREAINEIDKVRQDIKTAIRSIPKSVREAI